MMQTTDSTYFPWEPTTAPSTPVYPEQPPWKQPDYQVWPSSVEPLHPAELEEFEEFVIWACGFTDPEHPPSQKKWEEFQQKVMELAATFVEYKRQRREANQPYRFNVSNMTSADIDEIMNNPTSGNITTL